MKNKTTVDADARLDALLAGTPLRPREDFSRRVFAAIADETLDAKLAEQPLAPSADFADRVMSALNGQAAPSAENALAFPRRRFAGSLLRFARFAAAGAAAVVAASFGFVALSEKSVPLGEQVAAALESDPELAALAASDEDFSYVELVAASRLLTLLNENSAETEELFAYYEN